MKHDDLLASLLLWHLSLFIFGKILITLKNLNTCKNYTPFTLAILAHAKLFLAKFCLQYTVFTLQNLAWVWTLLKGVAISKKCVSIMFTLLQDQASLGVDLNKKTVLHLTLVLAVAVVYIEKIKSNWPVKTLSQAK